MVVGATPCISDLESSARGAITKDGDASFSDAGMMQTDQYPERKRFTRTEPPRRRLCLMAASALLAELERSAAAERRARRPNIELKCVAL